MPGRRADTRATVCLPISGRGAFERPLDGAGGEVMQDRINVTIHDGDAAQPIIVPVQLLYPDSRTELKTLFDGLAKAVTAKADRDAAFQIARDNREAAKLNAEAARSISGEIKPQVAAGKASPTATTAPKDKSEFNAGLNFGRIVDAGAGLIVGVAVTYALMVGANVKRRN